MIGDVLLDCAWAGQTLAGFENHAGRTILDPGAEPLGRVVDGFGNDGESGFEGCRYRSAYGTYLHGPLLPRNPWFADRVLSDALRHAGGDPELAPLPDELEQQAHAVSAGRARARGGKALSRHAVPHQAPGWLGRGSIPRAAPRHPGQPRQR